MGDSKSVSALRRSACGDMRISNMRYGYDASLEYPSVECFIQPIVSRQNSCCTSRATESFVWQSYERICNMLSLKHETLFPSQQMKQHLNQLQQQYSLQKQHFNQLQQQYSLQKQHFHQLQQQYSLQKQHFNQLQQQYSLQKQHFHQLQQQYSSQRMGVFY